MRSYMSAACFAAFVMTSGAAFADEVTDLLSSAQEAYAAGDIQFALDDIEMARSKLIEMKTASLGAFLPEAPEGWTREVNTEMSQAMGMLGGGVGAEANYSNGDKTVKLSMMADNPMVASMAAMVTNAGAMGMKTERIGRQKFASQENQIMGMVANRILIQAEGDLETSRALLEMVDFEKLGTFGQ